MKHKDDSFIFSSNWRDWCGLVPQVQVNTIKEDIYEKETKPKTYTIDSLYSVTKISPDKLKKILSNKAYDKYLNSEGRYNSSIVSILMNRCKSYWYPKDIRKKFELTPAQWTYCRKKLNLHNQNRYNEEQYKRITEYFSKTAFSSRMIAKRLGCSQNTVLKIIKDHDIKKDYDGGKKYNLNTLKRIKQIYEHNHSNR